MEEWETAELSEREREILALVATGATNYQIARALHISPNTVKVHLRNIFAKLGVESRTEAALYAVQQGWVELPGPGVAFPAETPAPSVRPARPAPIGPLRRAFFVLSALALVLALWLPYPQAGQGRASGDDFGEVAARAPLAAPYLPTASRWQSRAQMPTPRGRLAVAAWEGRLIAIGGMGEEGVTGRVEVYDPAQNAWTSASPLPTPAANIQAAVLEGKVYVPGGYGPGGTFLDILQVYDPATDTWTLGPRLPRPLAGYALAVHRGSLYLFGGSDGAGYRADAYRYDPAQGLWTPLPPMPTRRGFAGAASLGGAIFVVGGYDGARELNVCERFEPQEEAWHPCAPMRVPRAGVGVAALGDSLYVIGGGWQSYLAFHEKYAPATDSWTTFESPILGEWRLLGVAALEPYIYAVGGVSGQVLSATQAYQAQFRILLPIAP
ncbi:MAG: Kelch repeat-containing protein [Anaerolineae bacterium]